MLNATTDLALRHSYITSADSAMEQLNTIGGIILLEGVTNDNVAGPLYSPLLHLTVRRHYYCTAGVSRV